MRRVGCGESVCEGVMAGGHLGSLSGGWGTKGAFGAGIPHRIVKGDHYRSPN